MLHNNVTIRLNSIDSRNKMIPPHSIGKNKKLKLTMSIEKYISSEVENELNLQKRFIQIGYKCFCKTNSPIQNKRL